MVSEILAWGVRILLGDPGLVPGEPNGSSNIVKDHGCGANCDHLTLLHTGPLPILTPGAWLAGLL